MCLHQLNGTIAAGKNCWICEGAVKRGVDAKISKIVQSAGKALVTAGAKKTGFLGPTLSGTGNTQKKM